MNTRFNISDTVIDNKGIKGKIVDIRIDEFGIKYSVKHCSDNRTEFKYEDELIKAPVTREEALTIALKEIGKRISKRIDVELSEDQGCFKVYSKTHNGPYIGFSKDEYHYDEE